MRPQTHLMALLTILPKFDLSSAMGISSGFISVLIALKWFIFLRRNTNIVARSHLNQSFDFFRDVEVKPRRIFSSKGWLGDILTVTIYWNQFPEAHFFARHQIAIKGYHLTLDMTINIKKLLALRNQVWHCEPGLALLSTPLRSRFIWVEVQYKLQTIIYNISHISYLLLIV